MADVTIAGANGSPVNISFGSGANAQAAQQALANVAKFIANGSEQVLEIPAGTGTLPLPDSVDFAAAVGVVGDVGSVVQDVVPAGYTTLINGNSGLTVLEGAQDTTLVESGANGEFLYGNTAANARIFLGGGINEVFNAFDGASMTVNLDGPASVGATAAAIVDGAFGSTTVNVADGALVNVLQGNVSVVGQGGSDAVEVSAPDAGSTGVVTVSGVAGATIDYLPGGGQSFITPGAANVIVLATGLGGSETLFGGSATIGGQTVNANAFTGSATVFSGTGYFQGGSAGDNSLTTSTLAGAATLVGGGSGDSLTGYGVGDMIVAGAGNETLVGQTGNPVPGSTVPSNAGGQLFVLGNGSAQDDLVGDNGGNDTIKLGSGSATITVGHQLSNIDGIVSPTSANTILEQSGLVGGNVTINGFLASNLGWGISDVVSLNAGVTAQVSVVGGNSVATLSDGTHITFANVTNITNGGSILT